MVTFPVFRDCTRVVLGLHDEVVMRLRVWVGAYCRNLALNINQLSGDIPSMLGSLTHLA
jgi:hypothetical protein